MFIRYLSLVFTVIFTISSAVYAVTGAGVMTFFDDGTVLLGKEMRRGGYVWSDFGGKTDPRETRAKTGWREANEETAGTLKKHITLARVKQAEANGHYVDHNHAATGLSYRMYLIRVHGPKPSIPTFHRNAVGKAHVDKADWKYFDATVIMNAHNRVGNLPGTNEPVYGPMKACLRNPTTQQFFANFINSVRLSPPPRVSPVAKKPAPKIKKAHQIKRKSAPKIKKTHRMKRRTATIKRRRIHKHRRRG